MSGEIKHLKHKQVLRSKDPNHFHEFKVNEFAKKYYEDPTVNIYFAEMKAAKMKLAQLEEGM